MRHFRFPVDPEYARAVNEILTDLRRRRIIAVVTAVAFGGIAAGLIVLNHPWSWILAVVLALAAMTALWVAIWAPHRTGHVEKLYAEGALVPAMIAEVRPHRLTLLALVNVARPNAPVARYALVTRSVRTLPGHQVQNGERVPAVSVLSDRTPRPSGPNWQSASPMPIAWGTRDSAVLERAEAAIPDEEWQLLADNLTMSKRVRGRASQRILLDPHELPTSLADH